MDLCILGSTGSIGRQALEVARLHKFNIAALAAHSSADELERQIREFSPAVAALYDEKAAKGLKIRVKDTFTKIYSGMDGLTACAEEPPADTVLNSVVGLVGLRPTVAAINAGKRMCLANKESLVAGGKLVMDAVENRKKSAEGGAYPLIPVDSEHSAIFQCLQAKPPNSGPKKIILTASGGPFFGKTKEGLENATLAGALKHPNWSMGAKITVDSATMFNKGLELIEAVWLFDMKPENVDIVIHRESIIHSLIEFCDNSVLAQLGVPDMRIPIQYALTYPDRYPSDVKELNLAEILSLTFAKPDYETFKCLDICKEAIKRGGLYPAAVNSANEEANMLFRQGKIRFCDIAELAETALSMNLPKCDYSLDDVDETDKLARNMINVKCKLI